MKQFRQLERISKGIANHRRIQILYLLDKTPELSVGDISDCLNVHFKTISSHVARLAVSGLLMKRSDSRSIRHKLTPRGVAVVAFLKRLR